MTQPPTPLSYASPAVPLSRLAVTALVCGFAALPGFLSMVPIVNCLCFIYLPVAGIAAILAIVFGILGLLEVRRSGGRIRGSSQAASGLAMGGALIGVYAAVFIIGIAANVIHGSWRFSRSTSWTITPTTTTAPASAPSTAPAPPLL